VLLLVGLGNPGPKYERNRHNLGYMAVDEIVRRHSFSPYRARFQSLVAEGSLGGEKVLAMKPTTFMNESGRAVGEAMRFYKLDSGDVLVMHDELDLVAGKIRIKQGGGHAGHNGLRSVDAHIGKEYHRLRLGIGHPGDKDRVHGYVLSDFAKAERPLFEKLVDAMAESADKLGDKSFDAFMTNVSRILKPPRPNSDKPGAPAPDAVSES
jgi:PTH1 family peptidyl-tRNA hydrolase